ncbi:hypothetical protein WME89_28090 [Sorangium sp. So ce321]|uniref:hypothetical protein n=1 Tax=Sorangium sp. So ce321 TaxID=3133300 RepID=UPI003F6218C6
MSKGRSRWWTEAPGSSGRARAAALALAVALAPGCGSVCDEAAEHTEECGYEGSDAAEEASCEGDVRCASECAAGAPCGAFDGTDAAAFERYMSCLDAC